ncbi:histidinol-phosphatase HisJ family protein [candidate division WOR-3 bacterium]|nr:histidinol-phosphatase HisJ family protein [candidate division WOR-3 bacterium]
MIDYHIHPDYSSDAQGRITDYCQQALKVGIKELCFTTHYEPDPMRAEIEQVMVAGQPVPVDSDWVDMYLEDIEKARRDFPELIIRSGVEVGYERGLEGKIADFLERYKFDYVLGAIHCLDHIAITSGHELADFRNGLKPRGAEYIAQRYFDYVRAAAGSKLFDCIAHLDIWRKYILPEVGVEFLTFIEPGIVPMLGYIAQSGTGLEINSSALRRGDEEPYPQSKIIAQAIAAGVKTFTVGSDAHRVADLGIGVDKSVAILAQFGFKPTRFQNRQRY